MQRPWLQQYTQTCMLGVSYSCGRRPQAHITHVDAPWWGCFPAPITSHWLPLGPQLSTPFSNVGGRCLSGRAARPRSRGARRHPKARERPEKGAAHSPGAVRCNVADGGADGAAQGVWGCGGVAQEWMQAAQHQGEWSFGGTGELGRRSASSCSSGCALGREVGGNVEGERAAGGNVERESGW
eukprot:350273-Chlamydomonas_euryale.AAC.3